MTTHCQRERARAISAAPTLESATLATGAVAQRHYDAYKRVERNVSLRETQEEIARFSEHKKKLLLAQTTADEMEAWKDALRHQLEEDLARQVREALGPPANADSDGEGGHRRHSMESRDSDLDELDQLNNNPNLDLTDRERDYLRKKRLSALQAKRRMRRLMSQAQNQQNATDYNPDAGLQYSLGGLNSTYNKDPSTCFGFYGLAGVKTYEHYAKVAAKALNNFGALSSSERHEFYYAFTKNGFREALRTGRMPDGSDLTSSGKGRYVDKYGIIRDEHGPFWPADYGPLFPAPVHKRLSEPPYEPMPPYGHNATGTLQDKEQTIDTQQTPYDRGKWRGVQIVYDSEKSPKDYPPPHVSEGNCPSLVFESRFESGNLRQARRIGQFEYELVLKTDLYTARHTQWYYFRVQNAVPGVTYKFKIVNLLKKDSLYNHGMRPLLYSEKASRLQNVGWKRAGHHINYSRNILNLHCPLLQRDKIYHVLEWQMEFEYENDVCYLAHCYPYTFSDLKDDLDTLMTDPERSKVMKREVMCESRAGNSCFLVTVTNFEHGHYKKKGIVISARVHPGETNSSWMMKGLLEYITGSSALAMELRNKFVFKIVPMLNPDGVIVGNYRCSLAARDLNRNYRHPRKESFPTVWHTKAMMEDFGNRHPIMLYCDLHGHSRKHNVFMYGCNTGQPVFGTNRTEAYLRERLFPWLMAQKAPDKFWFRACKFHIRRSKESTGRVVMFRQLKIHNSFTLEATFCGTTISSGEKRHFKTTDFQDMGKVLCESVLEYYQIQENKTRESEVVLDLTRVLTQHVLEMRGMLPDTLPDVTTEAGKKILQEYAEEGKVELPAEVSAAFKKLVNKELRANGGSTEDSDVATPVKSGGGSWTKNDVTNIIDRMCGQTIDGCVQILEQLDVTEEPESDSSDSDSESEPEMKIDSKIRKKKKKHKKSKSQADMHEKEKKKDSDRPKSISALPAIHSASDAENKRKKQGSMRKYVKHFAKTYPGFVNKYLGRSNGGIPCFSEERMLERAAKRMEEMKRRVEDDRQRRESICNESADEEFFKPSYGMGNFVPGGLTQRYNTQFDMRSTLQQGSSQAHIRMGYMHGAGSPCQDQPASSRPLDTRPPPLEYSSDSDSDGPNADCVPRAPISAMVSPYQLVGGANQATMGMHPLTQVFPGKTGPFPLPLRSRLPLVRGKTNLSGDSSSIPPRHTSSSSLGITPVSRTIQGHVQGQGHGHDPHSSDGSLSCRGKTFYKDGNLGRVGTAKPHHLPPESPHGVAAHAQPFLTSEYADVLLNRLKVNRASDPVITASTAPSFGRSSHRHSTCE